MRKRGPAGKRLLPKRRTAGGRRPAALVLCAALLFGMLPLAAAGDTDAVCTNHPEHDGTCGYEEAVAEVSPCAHVHDEDCGYVEGDPESCAHVHDEICGYQEEVQVVSACTHSCELCEPGEEPEPTAEPVSTEEPGLQQNNALLAAPEGETQGQMRGKLEDYAGDSLKYTIKYGGEVLTEPTSITIPKEEDEVEFSLRYEFSITDILKADDEGNFVSGSHPLAAGDTLTVALPTNLVWPADDASADMMVTDESVGEEAFKLATLSATEDAKQATLTFEAKTVDLDEDYYDNLSELTDCYIELSCSLDKSKLENEKRQEISIMIGTTNVTFRLEYNKPAEKPSITKTGSAGSDTGIPHLAEWTVTIDPKGYGDAEGVVFSDTLVNQTYVENSFKVNDVSATPTVEDNVLKYTFSGKLSDSVTDGKIKIEFSTQPTGDAFEKGTAVNGNSGDKIVLDNTNQAKLTYIQGEETKFDVTAKGGKVEIPTKWITKSGERVAPADGEAKEIHWTVTINTCGYTLNNLVLHDIIPEGLVSPSDIKVGNVDKSAESSSCRVDGCNFEVKIGDSQNGTVTVTYTTKIQPGDSFKNKVFTNRAYITFDDPYGVDGSPEQVKTGIVGKKMDAVPPIEKSGSYDRATHQNTWTITVNRDQLPLVSAIVTDIYDNANGSTGPRQKYVDNSMEITIGGTKIDNVGSMVEWVGTDAQATERKFTVDFSGGDTPPAECLIRNKTAVITYKTELTDPKDYGYNSNNTCHNTAVLTAQLTVGTNLTSQDGASPVIPSNVLTKGGGEYNYTDKTVHWTFKVNENQMPMPAEQNPQIVDTLPLGLTYKPESLKFGNARQKDSLVSTTGDGKTENQVVTISLGAAADNKQLTVSFDTELDVDLVGWDSDGEKPVETIKLPENSAYLSRSGDVFTEGSTLTVTKKKPNDIDTRVLVKTGKEQTVGSGDDSFKYIEYSILINRLGLTLDHLPEGMELNTVVDEMSKDLQLDRASLKLERGTMDADGKVFTPLDNGEIAPIDYTYESGEAANILTVRLPEEYPASVYRLSYRADVTLTEQGNYTLTNKASLNGAVNKDSSKSSFVQIDAAAAAGQAKRLASLSLKKVDVSTGASLSGAVFAIYDADGFRICQNTTDDNGKLTLRFKPTADTAYTLKEVTPPLGYKDEDWAVTISALGGGTFDWEGVALPDGTTAENNVLTVPNALNKGSFGFTKKNDLGYALKDATFALYLDGVDAPVQTQTSDADGKVSFADVPYAHGGIYHLEETEAPLYHLLDGTVYTVMIDADGRASLTTAEDQSETVTEIINDAMKGSITVLKVDKKDQAPLSGAVFALTDAKGKEVGRQITGPDGAVKFGNLMLGMEYTLAEVSAPAGYDRWDATEKVTLTSETDHRDVEIKVENALIPPPPTPTPGGGGGGGGGSDDRPAPSPSPEVLPSPTPTVSPSPTPSVSPSPTPSVSLSPTPSASPSPMPSDSPSPTSTAVPDPAVSPEPAPEPAPPVEALPKNGIRGEVRPGDPSYYLDDAGVPRGIPPVADPDYWLDDAGIPLGYRGEDGEWEWIEEDEIPLGFASPDGEWVDFVPQTGDSSGVVLLVFLLSGGAAVALTAFALRDRRLRGRKRR